MIASANVIPGLIPGQDGIEINNNKTYIKEVIFIAGIIFTTEYRKNIEMIVGAIKPMLSPNVAVLYSGTIMIAPFGEECNRTYGLRPMF